MDYNFENCLLIKEQNKYITQDTGECQEDPIENDNESLIDEYDEEIILKEIEMCQDEQDLKYLIDINTSNLNYKKDDEYEFVLQKAKCKMFALMKIIKNQINIQKTYDEVQIKNLFKKNDFEFMISEHEELQQKHLSQQNRIKEMQLEILSKRVQYDDAINQLKKENMMLAQLNQMFERDLNYYRGNFECREMDIKQISNIEQELNDALQSLSKKKTLIIESLQESHTNLQKNSEDISKCVVCLTNNIQYIMIPCNHVILCGDCCTKVDKCPMDRTPIQRFEKIYLK